MRPYPSRSNSAEKRILIDANFADSRFGRQRSAGESVNVDLPAVWSRRRASQCDQLVGQFVRIVGKRIEILALEHDRVGVAAGFSAYLRRAFFIDSLRRSAARLSMAIEISTRFDWPAAERQSLRGKLRKSLHGGLHNIAAGRKSGYGITAAGVGGGGSLHSHPTRWLWRWLLPESRLRWDRQCGRAAYLCRRLRLWSVSVDVCANARLANAIETATTRRTKWANRGYTVPSLSFLVSSWPF